MFLIPCCSDSFIVLNYVQNLIDVILICDVLLYSDGEVMYVVCVVQEPSDKWNLRKHTHTEEKVCFEILVDFLLFFLFFFHFNLCVTRDGWRRPELYVKL